MKARARAQAVLAKLSRNEQQALIDYVNANVAKHKKAIAVRLYMASVCALWDSGIIEHKASAKWDKFIMALDDIIAGHADQAYGPRRVGEVDKMSRDMYEYLCGEGIKSKALDALYEESLLKEEEK